MSLNAQVKAMCEKPWEERIDMEIKTGSTSSLDGVIRVVTMLFSPIMFVINLIAELGKSNQSENEKTSSLKGRVQKEPIVEVKTTKKPSWQDTINAAARDLKNAKKALEEIERRANRGDEALEFLKSLPIENSRVDRVLQNAIIYIENSPMKEKDKLDQIKIDLKWCIEELRKDL